jgi:hypothetical protein
MNAIDSAAPAASAGRRRARRLLAGFMALLLAGTAGAQTVNPTGAAILEFQTRLEAYLQLRERATADVPKLKETPSPADISAHEQAMAKAIQSSREGAQIGDLVAPVERIVRNTVRQDWARRSPAERQALVAEVPRVARIVVNTRYPSTLPLATVPPVLLQQLPRLPESLEYRLMGRALVLRDVSANLIVDVVEKALPSQ